MQEKTKEPEIRFAGFTGAWEQRKLSDIAERITRKNTHLESTLPLTISSSYGLIDQYAYFNNRVASRNTRNYYLIKNGEFAYNKSYSDGFPFGSVKRLDRYAMGVLSTLYIIFSIDYRKVNSDFLVSYYDTKNWHHQVALRAAEGARNHGLLNISADDFFETELKIPMDLDEQKKIGSFFVQLNSFITLHQRKYEKLLNIKKSMLEKMFPKEGEVVPEIRFKGFTGAWEQRKLSDIAERITRKNTHLESTLPLTISSSYGLIDQYAYFNNRVASRNTRNYYLIKNGEFAYNKSYSDGFPFGSVKRLDRYAMGVLSTLYIIFSIDYRKVNSDFLVSYYDTKNWHHQVALRAAEGARNHGLLNISADDFFETELKIPMDLDEQKKIGSFFVQLNSFITLHQRKLEMLKNVKQAFLEKMFV